MIQETLIASTCFCFPIFPAGRKVTAQPQKGRKQGAFSTLLNMEGLRKQFNLAQNIFHNESKQLKNYNINSFTHRPDSNTFEHNEFVQTMNPREIISASQNTTPSNTSKNSSPKPMDKQEHSIKLQQTFPWYVGSQTSKDGDLPKRVSFNDIPDYIATSETGRQRVHKITNRETGINPDSFQIEPPGEARPLNQAHLHKQCKCYTVGSSECPCPI